MDDSDIEMTPEDEIYQPDEYRPPGDALMLEPDKANRMNAFFKKQLWQKNCGGNYIHTQHNNP